VTSTAVERSWATLRDGRAWLMAAIVIASGAVMIAWSHLGDELIPVRRGLGYDGLNYADWVKDPANTIFAGNASHHRIQRIVPSLLVHGVLRPFGLHDSEPAIIVAFQLLNLSLLVLGCFVWMSISRRLQLSTTSAWVGFLALFVNYAVAKFAFYYPVLTDTSGYVCGLLLVWCLVHRKYAAMLALAVVTAFTWPTVYLSALLLFALSGHAPAPPVRQRWGTGWAALLTAGVVGATVYLHQCGSGCVIPIVRQITLEDWFAVSLVLVAIWVFAATQPLFARLGAASLLRSVNWPRLAIAIIVFVIISVVQEVGAQGSEPTAPRPLQNTLLLGASKPGIFLVAHTIYFGPGVVLAIAMWRRSAAAMARWGQAVPLLMTGYCVLALTAESRVQSNSWAFFVTFAVVALDGLAWRRIHVVVFAVLSVAVSRVWFPITRGHLTGDITKYPDQYYGMSIGWRMTLTSYGVMAAVTLASALVVCGLVFAGRVRKP
jgi:hypothetical protein